MITLQKGLELAIKAHACKGNLKTFKKALDQGDTLECYQIVLGSRYWLLERGIIRESDIPNLERLAQGVGKSYYHNGQLHTRINYKNGKLHGLREDWYDNGQLSIRANYRYGKRHGLYELWYSNGKLWCSDNYKNGKIVS